MALTNPSFMGSIMKMIYWKANLLLARGGAEGDRGMAGKHVTLSQIDARDRLDGPERCPIALPDLAEPG